ncbi:MAG: DEAD/DEAH box helicase [Legionellales bacterium]|nr:DEAD/DEAH box helicase [Legionellales bacterium]
MLKSALMSLSTEFPLRIFQQGQVYFQHGHVLTIRLSDGLLRGRVKGALGQIYDVHIDLRVWPKRPARCTCVTHTNCKHAVACFFALQEKENLTIVPLTVPNIEPAPAPVALPSAQDEVVYVDDFSWYSELETRGHDFFGYQLGILIDDKPISIVPLVVDLLRRMEPKKIESLPDDKEMYLPLAHGKWLAVQLGRIKPLLRLLLHEDLREIVDDELRLRRYHLTLMQEVEAAIQATRSRWLGTEAIRAQLEQLQTAENLLAVDPPQGIQTVLRDYQLQGLSWLNSLQEYGFSGILADDMGLGKTVQALAYLLLEKERGHAKSASLIVAPTSLVRNWLAEAQRFTPDLKVLVFHGTDRHLTQFDGYDLVISTYGTVARDKALFLQYTFHYLILDEAQFIKNSRTKTTQIMQQLHANHRLCLTGTPLENHLGELWSLFHFLMPGLLGSIRDFRHFFRVPIEREGSVERRNVLSKRVQPFMLRRTKDQVVRELPPKTEMLQMIELRGPQRDLYEGIRMMMEKKVREAIASQGLGKSQIVLLDALLKLRQICCDPRLLSFPEAVMAHGESAKLDTLMGLLDNLIEEGRKVLVFSQFTSMLRLIEERLVERQYTYLKLTGQTQQRQELVDRFQAGEASVFLISLKAGGTGLNLTRADTVILYDPWWNPAVQDQAAGRSHRIGQDNPVFIYKLVVAGTVEEAILSMQVRKKELVDSILSNHPTPHLGWTMEDIDYFFSPLKE